MPQPLSRLAEFDQNFYSCEIRKLAGVDEVGRGPLAGPVVAAICSMPWGLSFDRLDDSKRLGQSARRSLNQKLRTTPNVAWAISFVGPQEIDHFNILTASLIAMARALRNLQGDCHYLLVDGPHLPHRQKSVPLAMPPQKCLPIIKGDGKSQVIAAASILAKIARDDYMCWADRKWPCYGFAQHKGYPTPQHIAALAKYGPCPLHRQSFRPVADLSAQVSSPQLLPSRLKSESNPPQQ